MLLDNGTWFWLFVVIFCLCLLLFIFGDISYIIVRFSSVLWFLLNIFGLAGWIFLIFETSVYRVVVYPWEYSWISCSGSFWISREISRFLM